MLNRISFGQRALHYYDIGAHAQAAGRDISTFPFVIRILLENVCRHRAWGADVSDAEVQALIDWRTHTDIGLPLRAERVILPDSSGLPVLQDLAALRDAVARHGGNVDAVDAHIPLDLVVDHSLQVDHWGDPMSIGRNMKREFERNAERYGFLKWAQQAFRGLRVFPPGVGIIHQINLEYIAPVVQRQVRDDGEWVFPDFVIGGDSHTPMINALGVLGWGVGGIDAEAALLGHAYTFPVPKVVGVRLSGKITAPAMTTDAALLINRSLRAAGVSGCMVEFFGPAVAALPISERATIANMAPEYGATCGFFPVDEQTLQYLRETGRPLEQVALVEKYCRSNALWRDAQAREPVYSAVLDIDLSKASPGMAGPRRPHDLLSIGEMTTDFTERLHRPLSEGGFGIAVASKAVTPSVSVPMTDARETLPHGAVVLAAITSCTNTSNPLVMLAAGLVAQKAVARGIAPPAWVKTSLAPGSRSVTRYLERADLLAPLEKLGFSVIGYGCTTCGGKSGPLDVDVAAQIERDGLVAAAVLSGNRNFEGRIHKLIRANYIGSPPMVVLYALAGRIDIDLHTESLGFDRDHQPVYMRELWPTPEEIEALLPLANDRALFESIYAPAALDNQTWRDLQAPKGAHFPWNTDSLYLIEPPFFQQTPDDDSMKRLAQALQHAHVLAAFGDSLTTDHISPGGEIPPETPAGQYLQAAGVAPRDFNSYVARRCNYQLMTRATFANIRIKNALLPETEGGVTRHFPDGAQMTIFDAAAAYRRDQRATIILAGKEYGTGSSRDWAAKGSALLGIKAVIAESFERIHRANLIGMGVLPLAFMPNQGWRQLGLQGNEVFQFTGVEAGVREGTPIEVTASDGARVIRFQACAQVLTAAERRLMAEGGIPASVLRGFLPQAVATHDARI